MAQNMYRVGDYVYFETSSSAPYQIRKIEELNKTAAGNVEAKVLCYYRRREIPRALLKIADRAERLDDRNLINTRRHIGINLSRTANMNGDIKNEASSDDDEASNSTKNELDGKESSRAESAQREDSDSPKPMQVDTGEEENEDTKDDQVKSEAGQEEEEDDDEIEGGYGLGGLPKGSDVLAPRERHHLRQHELFLSRQVEALPATHIRGKCSVTLLSEVETPDSYLGREDAFFYSLVYDQAAMTLLADKGEIRVGDKYQCEVPEDVEPEAMTEDNKENGNLVIAEEENREEPVVTTTDREVLVYHPYHNLTDRDIDQFLIIARAVGTFSRALDTSSSTKLPSLHMTAAAASRDVTLLHAMALLHQANYDLGQAVKYLVPPPSKQHYPLDADKTTSHNTVSLGGPILCRDQMEEWSAAEANLFEEAIEKYGKDFNDIRGDFLPWKSLRDIIEYYYMWKTTNRYVEIKKNKAADQESKLKQVYIPNYNKPNPNLVGPPNSSGQTLKGTMTCESCTNDEAPQWYGWGPAHAQMRVCADCWIWWKKNGGLKRKHQYEAYDLDGATTQDMLNPAQQALAQKTQTTTPLNSGALNRTTTAVVTPSTRNGGIAGRPTGGQIIARLPPNHPQQVAQQKAAAAAAVGSSAVSATPKARVAFFLHTTLHMRIARRLAPKSLLNIRRSARRPFLPINGTAIKQYCAHRQPLEIIRAAKQIKGSKLSDIMLAQLAAVITANGAQAVQQAASMKRPLPVSDKNHPQAKRQQQLPQTQLQLGNAQAPNVALVHPQQAGGGVHQAHHSNASTSKKSGSGKSANRVSDVKAVPNMVPLPTMPGIMVPPNLAAVVANAQALLSQQIPRQFAPQLRPSGSSSSVGTKESTSCLGTKKLPDSRWNGADEKLLFLAGPRLKVLRKRLCSKRMTRRIALHPCRNSDFINRQLPGLQNLFT